eukprot:768535-Hanusia_phi.AAC.3
MATCKGSSILQKICCIFVDWIVEGTTSACHLCITIARLAAIAGPSDWQGDSGASEAVIMRYSGAQLSTKRRGQELPQVSYRMTVTHSLSPPESSEHTYRQTRLYLTRPGGGRDRPPTNLVTRFMVGPGRAARPAGGPAEAPRWTVLSHVGPWRGRSARATEALKFLCNRRPRRGSETGTGPAWTSPIIGWECAAAPVRRGPSWITGMRRQSGPTHSTSRFLHCKLNHLTVTRLVSSLQTQPSNCHNHGRAVARPRAVGTWKASRLLPSPPRKTGWHPPEPPTAGSCTA